MLPLQTLSDPAMAVTLLAIAMTILVTSGFIWAFGKISEEPETPSEEDRDRGGAGA
jgi:hypothetical protein